MYGISFYSNLLDISSSVNVNSTVNMIFSAIVIIALVMLCFFFSMCTGALNASSNSKLRHLAENNVKNADCALKIKNNSIKYSRCAQTGFSINAIAAAFIAETTYFQSANQLFSNTYLNDFFSSAFAFILVFLCTALLVISFGQILPNRLALENPDKSIISVSSPFTAAYIVLFPLTMFFSAISVIGLKIFGTTASKSAKALTEEKILMMVDEGKEKGVIEDNTKDMIENVFDFDDTPVGEIMTHRKDIVAVSDSEKITSLVDMAIKSGRSRIPVFHKDIDSITGIIYVKDLLKYVSTNAPTQNIDKDIIHSAVFVPQSKRCSEMFEYMTSHKTQIAVVVDEFGGTGGIITMEDLIESIVGNIQDEYDNEDDDIKKLNEYSFTVDGATPLDEITDLTGIDFNEDTNDTIAGIMLDRMGHIPKSGEHPSIMIKGTRFTVESIENRRISKVLVVKQHKQEK